jgi:hypothetical protein
MISKLLKGKVLTYLALMSIWVVFTMSMTINETPGQSTTIYDSTGAVVDSNFELTDMNIKPKGHNKLEIHITITNLDTETHSTNTTVLLLDSGGDVIAGMEQFDLSGDVLTTATDSFVLIFSGTDVTTTYTTVFVQLDDIT